MTKFLNISTDNTLGGNSPSDEVVSSQKALKEYIDNNTGGNAVWGNITGTLSNQTDLDNAVARVAVNEGAISTLNTTVADKAEQDDLDAAVARIEANEAATAANTSAINSFTAITPAEVEALFA